MFEKFLTLIGMESSEKQQDKFFDDLRAAVAILLVAAAKSDDDFDDREYEFIAKSLAAKLQLQKARIGDLMTVAATEEDGRVLEDAVQLIKAEFSLEHRLQLLSLVWSVIEADNIVTDAESNFALKLREALDLSVEQALAARKRAEHVKVDGLKGFIEASDELAAATKQWLAERAAAASKQA